MNTKNLEVVYLPLSDLLPYARNSRTHSDEQVDQIAASITEFGFTNPILIDKDNGIIAGHGRVRAAERLGLSPLPCIRLEHLSDAQRRAYVIADNQLALNAGWKVDILESELKALKDAEFDLDILGFDVNQIDSMLRDVQQVELPELTDGPKGPYQQIAFKLHDSQAEDVKSAILICHKMGPYDDALNPNKNANALARICEIFITKYGGGKNG